MTTSGFNDFVKLDELARLELLKKLARATMPVVDSRREHERFPYQLVNIPLVIEQAGGTAGRFLVVTRNLSQGGISFVHGSYIHAGCRCRISLPRAGGESTVAYGTTVSCRHIKGMLHEVGVRFDDKFDVSAFRERQEDTSPEETAPIELPSISGRSMFVSQRGREDASTVLSALHASGMSVTVAYSPEDAVKHLDSAFDVLIYDARFILPPPEDVGRLFRHAGFSGLLVAFAPGASGFGKAFDIVCPTIRPATILHAIADARGDTTKGHTKAA